MENEDLTEERLVKDIIQVIDGFNQLNFINCQKSADVNDPDGMFKLGYCYEYGIGVENNKNKAFIYYQKSANMDNSNGMYKVGYCYYWGIGVEIDKHKAFTYYLKSAEAGNAMGMFKTAICYHLGISVKMDENKFWEWIEKKAEYGKCAHCNEGNTSAAWCLSCDPDIETQWTSKNKDIDDFLKTFQLRTFEYGDVFEWIPFDRFSDVKEIGKGGFGSVYRATWSDGIRKIEKIDDIYKRSRAPNSTVALKTLPVSKTNKNSLDFLKEFKNHIQCVLHGSKLQIYGLTYNSKINEYFMVFQYANSGNIFKFLQSNFNELTWEFKLKQLRNISKDLDQIHDAGYVHADFHSGNILLDKEGDSYIADLGLSKTIDESFSKDDIYGVMPYVAPEVLSGKKQFTDSADVYSFGVIMAEMTTGQRPFDDYNYDTKLAVKICRGLRPEFASGTPDCYIELANQCMDSDPQNRPYPCEIYNKIKDWLKKLASDDENEIKKQFLNADKIIKTLPIISQRHSDHMYTSKVINTQKISNEIQK